MKRVTEWYNGPRWHPVVDGQRRGLFGRKPVSLGMQRLRALYLALSLSPVACGGVVEAPATDLPPEPPAIQDAGPEASCPDWQRPDGYCLAHCAPEQHFNCWRNAGEP